MQCLTCTKPTIAEHWYCDVCLVFMDDSYDREWQDKEQRRQAQAWDDLVTETEFKWRDLARESRERIIAKYPPKLLT